jgi:subtilisin family serine protease
VTGRRPVVAVLDTGCGTHPWLDGVVKKHVMLDEGEGFLDIGDIDEQTDPEEYFDQVGALDGGIDALSGHGTFIAGLVHQACPDADVVAWRVVRSEGPIIESDLVATLEQIAEVARRHRDGEPGGYPIDVLNLSMGYYHETPVDQQFDKTMYRILEKLGRCGVAVVCSAGNDSTARAMFPAAFGPWTTPQDQIIPTNADAVPVTAVGALNPNGCTDALFSNAGPWVTTYAEGALVMSTMPVGFQGGLEPMARTVAYQRTRESIDPDNFIAGFALWSGTSFAAPLFAGRIAQRMVDGIDDVKDGRRAARERARAAVEAEIEAAEAVRQERLEALKHITP